MLKTPGVVIAVILLCSCEEVRGDFTPYNYETGDGARMRVKGTAIPRGIEIRPGGIYYKMKWGGPKK